MTEDHQSGNFGFHAVGLGSLISAGIAGIHNREPITPYTH